MSAHVQQASMVSCRSMVLMVTVALHFAAIAALMTWRITEANSNQPAQSLIVDWFPERPRPRPEPITDSNPLVGIPIPVPQAPPRLIEIESDTALVGEPVTAVPSMGRVDPEPQAPVAVVETPLRFQAIRPSDDYYPATAIRLEQQGAVILRVCADAAGSMSGRPRVVSGSRHRLLDDAAVTWASEALRFTPATRDGAAIAACKDFRVNFTLH